MKKSEVLSLPDGLYNAAPNLYLHVQHEGTSRTWIFRYTVNRKTVKKSIGSAFRLSLAIARARADGIRVEIAKGTSLQDAIEAYVPGAKANKVKPTWNDVAEEALQNEAKVKVFKPGSKTLGMKLQKNRDYIAPVIGNLALEDITREDVLRVLEPLWKPADQGGKPETAKRVRLIMEAVFNYARFKRIWDGQNPATWRGNMDQALPAKNKIHNTEHWHALTVSQLRDAMTSMWSKVHNINERSFPRSMLAVLFGALTVTREVEFCLATWREIDLETATWCVDPSHRKGHHTNPLRVALSRQAIEVIKLLPTGEPDDYLFPGLVTPAVSLGGSRVVLQRESGVKTTMHGVRSTFKDWAEENLWHSTLSEAALSHRLAKNEVEAAYFRSDLLEQRRPLMQAWADAILPISNRGTCATRRRTSPSSRRGR